MNENKQYYRATAEEFLKIPGAPIAYWLSEKQIAAYGFQKLEEVAAPLTGFTTGDNDTFLRFWQEVSSSSIGRKWFYLNKGGELRKWYGNNEYVVDWENNGSRIRESGNSTIRNPEFYFREGVTWSKISSTKISGRYSPATHLFDAVGLVCFPLGNDNPDIWQILALFNASSSSFFLSVLNPTLSFSTGPVGKLPVPNGIDQTCATIAHQCYEIARADWDSYETSWDFKDNPLVAESHKPSTADCPLPNLYDAVRIHWARATEKMHELEVQNNEIFIRAYGLEGELSPDVPWNEVSLTCNPWYRYGREVPANLNGGAYRVVGEMPVDADLEKRLRADTVKELLSYAVGCMMGRYSLDKPGLVLADAGGTLEDYHAKLREAGVDTPRFTPDEDGILPILDADWFEDDIVTRLHAFLRAAFGEANFHANVAWIEEALGKDLRSYFVKDFYADHVQRYQKRPIYWLFSSRKGAFQALVYLHRYRPDTPGRVLGYLRSYIAKVAARIEALDRTAADPSAARSARTAALRERAKLAKAQAEIADYERDVLYPLSTERPALDLDDGVKVNYPKLGAALRKIF